MSSKDVIDKAESESSVYRSLMHIVLPISFQYLMSSLVSASDAFMLGFLDQESLSAVSLATQVAFVYSLFYCAFVYGLNVLASQYWGKKDEKTVGKVFAISMRYALITGMLFTVLTFVVPEQIMRIFTSDPLLIEKGAGYLRMVSVSFVLTGFTELSFGIMKVCDHAGLSSLIGSLAVVVNIVLNAVFIFGLCGAPELGIEGAALATVLARIFEVTCVLIFMLKGRCPKLNVRQLIKVDDRLLHKDYWKYSVPLLINQLGWGGGVTMYSVIMGHLGNDATAANSIASILRSMIASLCWGVASGVSIIIGGFLGRGQMDMAKKMGGKFVRLSLWIGVASGVVILALSPLVMNVVSLSDQATVYLKGMIFLASYYIIGNSLNSTIIGGIFPAGADTKFGMYCDVITLWIVIVPLGCLAAFVFEWPVMVVAFILTLDEFVKIPAVYIHYKKYKWLNNITR